MDVSQSDGGTRSGLLWEVERILCELDYEHRPNVLIMENVPQIHSEKDYPNFERWMLKLEELGYCNFYTDLNIKDFGIPQNRDRTFMVSIKGTDINYKFPAPFRRELNLKDMLLPNDKIAEKYYLSKKMIDYLTGINQKESKYDRGSRFESSLKLTNEDNIAGCITTAAGQRPTDNFIIDDLYENREERIYTDESPTLRAGRNGLKVGSVESVDLKRGYSVDVKEESEEPVDGVEIIGNYSKSNFQQTSIVGKNGIAPTFTENHGQVTAVVEKDESFIVKKYKEYGSVPEMFNPYNKTEITDVAPTQTTQSGSTTSSATILIRENTKDGYREAQEGDGINIGSRMHHQRGNVQKGLSQTLKTCCEVGVLVDDDRNLKEQLCDGLIENGLVKEGDCINHSYSNSRMDNPVIANREFNDCSPTLTTRVDTLGVAVKDDSAFTETEMQLFTEDGNVRRYIGSEQIDKFEEGDMATTTFPNGYGHGPRTHKDCSITLNTIDKPVVKHNLRIRKLVPKEAGRLMAFQDIDTDHMYECGLADAGIFHCYGDSLGVNVMLGILCKLYGLSNQETEKIIKEYIRGIKNE